MATINPNVMLKGTLAAIWNVQTAPNPDITASIEIALCGYGSQIPRVSGEALFSSPATPIIGMQNGQPGEGAAGTFEVMLYSNDQIDPSGTYYTITSRNGNGDILQVNAYVFNGVGNWDLSTLTPYDPNQPPPPLPPLITNLLLIVPYSSTPDFAGDTFTSWQITLAGDATASFTNLVDGNLYTIIIIQDATGAHKFNWPLNVYNATPADAAPNAMTVQTFVAVSNLLYPIGAGTYWP